MTFARQTAEAQTRYNATCDAADAAFRAVLASNPDREQHNHARSVWQQAIEAADQQHARDQRAIADEAASWVGVD